MSSENPVLTILGCQVQMVLGHGGDPVYEAFSPVGLSFILYSPIHYSTNICEVLARPCANG